MLSELMQGGRISLVVGFAATLVAMVIGGGVGILSGYFGGWLDVALMRVTDYLLVIPDLVFAIVIADVWGAEPVPRDHRHRHPGMDLHRADHPRPGHERAASGST